MTLLELALLVKKMRDHQRWFFVAPRGSDQKKHHLVRSRVMERRVDVALNSIITDATGLFKDEGGED